MHNTGNWSKQVGGKVEEEDEVYDKNFLKIYSDEFCSHVLTTHNLLF